MEVGLKMAMRASGKRYGWNARQGSEVGVIGLRGSYHGDTVSDQFRAVPRLSSFF